MSDVLVVAEDVHVAAQRSLVVEEPLPQSGITAREVLHRGADCRGVLDGDLAVDQHIAVSGRPLHTAPLVGREVVHLLDGRHAKMFEVVDDDPVPVVPCPSSDATVLDSDTETLFCLAIRRDAQVCDEFHAGPSVAPMQRARFDLRCQSRANRCDRHRP